MRFYFAHALDNALATMVDVAVDGYRGNEEALFEKLKGKYGDEPPAGLFETPRHVHALIRAGAVGRGAAGLRVAHFSVAAAPLGARPPPPRERARRAMLKRLDAAADGPLL